MWCVNNDYDSDIIKAAGRQKGFEVISSDVVLKSASVSGLLLGEPNSPISL